MNNEEIYEYENEEEVRHAVEDKLGFDLPPSKWDQAYDCESYHPPCSQEDIDELCLKIKNSLSKKEEPTDRNPWDDVKRRAEIHLAHKFSDEVEKFRKEVFGSDKPPFENLDEIDQWIKENKPTPHKEDYEPVNMRKVEDLIAKLQTEFNKAPGKRVISSRFENKFLYWRKGVRQYSTITLENTDLEEMRQLSEKISNYIGCKQSNATSYVLTGELPYILPMELRFHHHGDKLYLKSATLTIKTPSVRQEDINKALEKIRSLWDTESQIHLSEHDKHLVELRLSTDNINWKKRYKIWMQEYPEDWEQRNIRSVDSFRKATNRALAKFDERKPDN